MKAMLLAAGFGKRMLPLTKSTPKALLPVAGKPLLVHHLDRLKECGISDVVINIAHLGHLVEEALGDGSALGVRITYSHEPPDAPLETGGGIRQALPLLGDAPFLIISADSLAQYQYPVQLPDDTLGVLLMVHSKGHSGDYYLDENGDLQIEHSPASKHLTYTGCALLHPDIIRLVDRDYYPLADCFQIAIARGRLKGQQHLGNWEDVGTVEKLEQINQQY